jgi:drug/metabolite transporter (DMT)-like permease
MGWIFLAVAAQFLNALVALVDKTIVSDEKRFPKPSVYAFYTCLISGGWIIVYGLSLLPLPTTLGIPSLAGIQRPSLEVVALSFLSAYTFFTALVAMFTALRDYDASDVVPVIGSVSALGSFVLGYFFLDGQLTTNYTVGILLLALGTFLVSRLRFPWPTALMALYAGLFFAFHYVTLKGLFTVTSFDNGFFWSRVAMVFFALTLLMLPQFWERVRAQTKITSTAGRLLILGNKVLAGIASLLILKATDLGEVAVVQALGGLQFVFILILGLIFSVWRPGLLPGEQFRGEALLQKAIFVAVISIGFLVLFR